MTHEIKKLWAATRLHLWPERYWLVSLPREQLEHAAAAVIVSRHRFAALVMEHEEVSLTVCAEIWQKSAEKLPLAKIAGPYKVITFDLNVDLSVCGYLAPAAVRLAEAGVSIVPQCAFLKDHLAVKEEDAPRALTILEQLLAECRSVKE